MKTFLIFFQGFLLGRTGSSIIGATLVLSLIWWGGPYIGLKSQNARLWVMFAFLMLILAIWLGKLLMARYRSDQLRKVLQSGGGDGAGREVEIAELREKMDSTIASLKTSGLGIGYRGNAALYALPWYLIIGPAAAGKTTLLRNSGLHFPYDIGENSDIKGFGGTRNCDWWFSDEAVLLDTAGRYTTEEDDKDEWTAFLGMLKKYRPKMPVNGVIVAVSLVDILTADKEGIDWHVKIIRDRLNELITHLGGIFPVYLTITKTDLLHGFSTFFEDMGEEERDQVWGAWLVDETSTQSISQRFQEKIAELYGRLSKQRLHKLTMQRKFALKDQILDFPNQFKGATEKLQSFFNLLVKENPYQETPRFCGIYFTSGAQEGTPIQRIIGNLRQAFGFVDDIPQNSPRPATTGKGFFIKKFFEDVIFPNSDAVIRNKKSEVIQRWIKTGFIAASVALVIGCFILFSTSLTSNSILAHNGSEAVIKLEKAVKSKDPSMGDVYEALDQTYRHYDKLIRYEENLPWHLLFGIYQGDEQIKPLEKIMLASMEIVFFKSTQKHIEYRLTDYARQWDTFDEQGRAQLREKYYSEFKSYLMASQQDHLDPDYAAPVLASVWKGLILRAAPDIVFTPEDSDRLNSMVRFYLTRISAKSAESGLMVAQWPKRDDIVERSRQNLSTPPNAERLYTQIINKAKISLKPKSLDDMLKGAGRGIITSSFQMPDAFTTKEWRDFIYPEINSVVDAASRGDWVLGSYTKLVASPDDTKKQLPGKADSGQKKDSQEQGVSFDSKLADKLKADIRAQYFKEYADVWFTFIKEVKFVPSATMDDAAKKTLSAARSDGPIGELMRVVSKNINIYEPESEDSPRQLRTPVKEVDIVFADLRKFANDGDGMNTSILINQYLLVLSTIQGELERLSAAVDVNRESSLYAAKILSGSGGDLELYRGWVSTSSMLNGIEPRTRKVTENLLTAPISNAWGAILQEAASDIQRQWKNKILVSFGQNLSDKFPFNRNGKDAALSDVADFFNTRDGIYWNFVNEYLSPYLDKGRGGSWRVKTWLAKGPDFTPAALDSISRATIISNGLFRKGTDEPEFRFSVYPIPLLGLSETSLTVNGQEYRYRNEPQEWRKFNWPGNGGDAIGARVIGIQNSNNNSAELNYSGFWGIFRLIDHATLKKESSREYLYTWNITGANGSPLKVQFMLMADRDGNILEKNILTGFSLPSTLFTMPSRIGG